MTHRQLQHKLKLRVEQSEHQINEYEQRISQLSEQLDAARHDTDSSKQSCSELQGQISLLTEQQHDLKKATDADVVALESMLLEQQQVSMQLETDKKLVEAELEAAVLEASKQWAEREQEVRVLEALATERQLAMDRLSEVQTAERQLAEDVEAARELVSAKEAALQDLQQQLQSTVSDRQHDEAVQHELIVGMENKLAQGVQEVEFRQAKLGELNFPSFSLSWLCLSLMIS